MMHLNLLEVDQDPTGTLSWEEIDALLHEAISRTGDAEKAFLCFFPVGATGSLPNPGKAYLVLRQLEPPEQSQAERDLLAKSAQKILRTMEEQWQTDLRELIRKRHSVPAECLPLCRGYWQNLTQAGETLQGQLQIWQKSGSLRVLRENLGKIRKLSQEYQVFTSRYLEPWPRSNDQWQRLTAELGDLRRLLR